jgi:hypothetical protein
MGIELNEFHRRLRRRLVTKGDQLNEFLAGLCPVDRIPLPDSGVCRVCGRQVREPVEQDPIPAGVMVPVDEAKAARLREFYRRYNAERRQRDEAEAAARKTSTTQPEPERGRDWSRVVTSDGRLKGSQ